MFKTFLSYRSLIRIVGTLFLSYGFYLIVCALTSQFKMTGAVQYSGPLIFFNSDIAWNYILYGGFFLADPILPMPLSLVPILPEYFVPGPILYVGVGILCFGLASMHKRVIHWCLQIALWFTSLSLWMSITTYLSQKRAEATGVYESSSVVIVSNNMSITIRPEFVPLLLVTVCLSLVLWFVYKSVVFSVSQRDLHVR